MVANALDTDVRPAPDGIPLSPETVLQLAPGVRTRFDTVGHVLVDAPGVGRSHREAPEIDGVVHLPAGMAPGTVVSVRVQAAMGPDLVAGPA